jgi:cytochrome d ubiquinol oxidase subunit II
MELQTVWFFIWGLLWAVFFMTDGANFGVGTLYPFMGKSDEDKRIMLNSIGPLWDGNEVWLITAGGVTFAAFPAVYAAMFSSLYPVFMLILFALILRGVSFEFRGKVDSPTWRKIWDACIFIGSFAPALLFGAFFANIIKGMPIGEDGLLQGTLLTLVNPCSLLGGSLFVLLFLVHGALWLAIKSSGARLERALAVANKIWPFELGIAAVFVLASFIRTPLRENYLEHPVLFVAPLVTVLSLLGIKFFLLRRAPFKAWFASALTIVGAIFYTVIGLFPNMFPSSIDDQFSLTAHNASSSPLTLKIMLIVVLIFIPIVIGYQIWAYKLFSDKISAEDLAHDEAY